MDEATKKLKQRDPKESEIFLLCDNENIILNKFAQETLKNVNLAFFQLLNGVPPTNEIKEFIIELNPMYVNNERVSKIQKDSNEAIGSIDLKINNKKVGMKQFVQNLILNMNMGITDTFMDIPYNPSKIMITYKKKSNF